MTNEAGNYIKKNAYAPIVEVGENEDSAPKCIPEYKARRAVNLALEQVRREGRKNRYSTSPTKRYHAINWPDLDKIINSLKF